MKELHWKTDVEAIVEKVATYCRVSLETICQKRRPVPCSISGGNVSDTEEDGSFTQ
jgi:hypothetical protein